MDQPGVVGSTFSFLERYLPPFLEAALLTVEISALAILLGLVLGAVICAMRLSTIAPLRWLGTAYVSLFRGTPCLVQILLLYFGGPQIGLDLAPFTAGVIGLAMNIAAYMAESMRGAVRAVDRGQVEAARAIGFSRGETMRRVILPQAARLMVRPLGVNAIALIKGSSIVSAISMVELTYTARRFVSSNGQAFEMFTIAAALYLIIVYATRWGIEMLDRKVAFQ